MKYAVEKGSGAIILYIKFRKDWFGNSEVDKGGFTDTQAAWRSRTPTLRK
jgi:hypothetical protein